VMLSEVCSSQGVPAAAANASSTVDLVPQVGSLAQASSAVGRKAATPSLLARAPQPPIALARNAPAGRTLARLASFRPCPEGRGTATRRAGAPALGAPGASPAPPPLAPGRGRG